MRFEKVAETQRIGQHLPSLGGRPLSSVEYSDEIAAGFGAMYHFLLEHRSALGDPAGPLAAFRGQLVRVILRPTQLYSLLVLRSRQGNLSDGADWSLHFEFLTRFSIWEEHEDALWAVQKHERAALVNLDIPYFVTRTDSKCLRLPDISAVVGRFAHSGFDRTLMRLQGLSESDLDLQLGLIRQALENAGVRVGSVTPRKFPSEAQDRGRSLTATRALDTARAFAELLDRQAIRAGGGAAWIGAVAMPREERSQLRVIGYDLYSGATGVAMFLAALDRLDGADRYRDLALAALAPLREEINCLQRGPRLARSIGIGGAVGLGSVVYGLARSGLLLGEASLLDDARRAALLITDDRIAENRTLDVISGAAGAILGLLALYQVCRDEPVLERAVVCGRHLLDRQEIGAVGSGAWTTIENTPVTGFSHGAAGIVLALLRLFRATRESAFLCAARSGLEFERRMFSPETGNWLDFSDSREGAPDFRCRWCHGAPGIALARVGGLDVLDDNETRTEIEVGLETTARFEIGETDHLCCGNFGRLEALLAAGRRLDRPELVELARDCAELVIECRMAERGFQWAAGTDTQNPGFFTGVSGVGYEILRLSNPAVLPSVLLWE
jgi:type 2 lantibiotic biosynthesis protein LanM